MALGRRFPTERGPRPIEPECCTRFKSGRPECFEAPRRAASGAGGHVGTARAPNAVQRRRRRAPWCICFGMRSPQVTWLLFTQLQLSWATPTCFTDPSAVASLPSGVLSLLATGPQSTLTDSHSRRLLLETLPHVKKRDSRECGTEPEPAPLRFERRFKERLPESEIQLTPRQRAPRP